MDTQTNFGIGIMCRAIETQFPKQILNFVGRKLGYGDDFHCSRPLITRTPVQKVNWDGKYENEILGQAMISGSLIKISDKFSGHLIYINENRCSIDWIWDAGTTYYDEDYCIRKDHGFDLHLSYGTRKPLSFKIINI